MTQSLIQSYWWVLGYIYNFDLKSLNLPTSNIHIYDEDDKPIPEQVKKMLKGKRVVRVGEIMEERNE